MIAAKKGLEKYVVSCTGKEKDNCKELSKRARNSQLKEIEEMQNVFDENKFFSSE